MTTANGVRPPDPEDLRHNAEGAEDESHADRDQETHLPPRRWRPRKLRVGAVGATDGFTGRPVRP
jgi:hypothetical protein